jgi:hypothetical protein
MLLLVLALYLRGLFVDRHSTLVERRLPLVQLSGVGGPGAARVLMRLLSSLASFGRPLFSRLATGAS